MFSSQFYEKRVSVRERNIKLLLKTVTNIAITETVTCIIARETAMCILHYEKYNLHNCNRDSTCIITIKLSPTYLLQKLSPA